MSVSPEAAWESWVAQHCAHLSREQRAAVLREIAAQRTLVSVWKAALPPDAVLVPDEMPFSNRLSTPPEELS